MLTLSETERDELVRLGRSQSAPHSLVRCAQIILASADGEANTSTAHRFGVSNPTVCHWRKKWFDKASSASMVRLALTAPEPTTKNVSQSHCARRSALEREAASDRGRQTERHGHPLPRFQHDGELQEGSSFEARFGVF